jgi:hypothetical protein
VIAPCATSQLFDAGQECSSGPITFWGDQGRSRYNGLLVKLNEKFSNHFQSTVSYQLAEQRADTAPADLLNYAASYGMTIPRTPSMLREWSSCRTDLSSRRTRLTSAGRP